MDDDLTDEEIAGAKIHEPEEEGALSQLAEVRHRLDAMDEKEKNGSSKSCVTFQENSDKPEEKEEVIPLKEVIKERETRKLRFDTMLTALENKHEQEKEKAEKLNSKLNEQIAELMARLENSEKQISTLTLLTQAQRDKDRDFNGRETT